MAIDTLKKRISALATLWPQRHLVPPTELDTFVSSDDRRILLGYYMGLALETVVAPSEKHIVFTFAEVIPQIGVEGVSIRHVIFVEEVKVGAFI